MIAAGFETSRCRAAVRGFRLSLSQSASRLKTIAAVRAKIIASTVSAAIFHSGQPRAATSIAPSAKGSAKIVCENRMNLSVSASIYGVSRGRPSSVSSNMVARRSSTRRSISFHVSCDL